MNLTRCFGLNFGITNIWALASCKAHSALKHMSTPFKGLHPNRSKYQSLRRGSILGHQKPAPEKGSIRTARNINPLLVRVPFLGTKNQPPKRVPFEPLEISIPCWLGFHFWAPTTRGPNRPKTLAGPWSLQIANCPASQAEELPCRCCVAFWFSVIFGAMCVVFDIDILIY